MAKRAYKPTKLKVLEGNRGRRPLPEKEPVPSPVLPPCPDDLDDDAKSTWGRLAPIVCKLGLLTEPDGDNFAIVCQIRSRLRAIHQYIKKENPSLVQETQKADPDGGVRVEYKPSPYVVMEKQYYQLFRLAAAEFGLSPRSRVGLSVGKDSDSDEMADLLS